MPELESKKGSVNRSLHPTGHECDFCGRPVDGKLVLRDPGLEKADGSDIVLCPDCLSNYAAGNYDKINLKGWLEGSAAPSPAERACKNCGHVESAHDMPVQDIAGKEPIEYMCLYASEDPEGDYCGCKEFSPAGPEKDGSDAPLTERHYCADDLKRLGRPSASPVGGDSPLPTPTTDDGIVAKVLKDFQESRDYIDNWYDAAFADEDDMKDIVRLAIAEARAEMKKALVPVLEKALACEKPNRRWICKTCPNCRARKAVIEALK